jgi:hypothetical protein
MTLTELYARGYAIGTGARIRQIGTDEEFILANISDYVWCAVSLVSGNRWRDPCKFNCAFQADYESVKEAVGFTDDWELVV